MALTKTRPRERYSLKPHEKRELAQFGGKKINRKALRGLQQKYGVALKIIHEALEHHGAIIDAAEPQSRPDQAKPSPKKRPKLGLSIAKEESVEELSTEDALLARKLELDRREAEIRRREIVHHNREKILEQDRQEVDLILQHADDVPVTAEMEALERENRDLKRRIAVLSGEARNDTEPKLPLYSAGIVKQMLLVKNAEIARLKSQIAATPRSEEGVRLPESMMVM